MTSYQRQKRQIQYLRQCVAELEGIVREILRNIPGAKLPLPPKIDGDQFITPYNSGTYAMEILAEAKYDPSPERS